MQLALCWSGTSHLHQWRQKSNCSSDIVIQLMCMLIGVIHASTPLENFLAASDTFKRTTY